MENSKSNNYVINKHEIKNQFFFITFYLFSSKNINNMANKNIDHNAFDYVYLLEF